MSWLHAWMNFPNCTAWLHLLLLRKRLLLLQREISSVPVLTSNWTSTVLFFGMVLVGLQRLKPRSAKLVALPVWKLIITRRMATISMSPILNWATFLLIFSARRPWKIQNALVRRNWHVSKEICLRRVRNLPALNIRFSCGFVKKLANISSVCNSWLRRLQRLMFYKVWPVLLSRNSWIVPFFMKNDELKSTKVAIQLSRKSWEPSPIFRIASLWMKNGIFSWLQGQTWAGSLPICANWRSLWFLRKLAPMFQRKRLSCQSLMRFIPGSELLMTWYRVSLPLW